MALRLIPCQACQDCWWIETLCLLPTCGLSFLQIRYTQLHKCLALGTIHNTKPSNRQQVSQAATSQGLRIVLRWIKWQRIKAKFRSNFKVRSLLLFWCELNDLKQKGVSLYTSNHYKQPNPLVIIDYLGNIRQQEESSKPLGKQIQL
jgi:hypothetical protein